jgi:hypothetical protein
VTSTKPIQIYNFENISENLSEEEEMDEMETYEKEIIILRTITDTKTRWDSSYQSWQRLLKLRSAIEWLSVTLPLQKENGTKEDSTQLNCLMLKDYEWELLKELVEIFKPFDELTTYFSGIQYTTLSVVNPSIEALKFEYADYIINESDEFIEDDFGK